MMVKWRDENDSNKRHVKFTSGVLALCNGIMFFDDEAKQYYVPYSDLMLIIDKTKEEYYYE